MKEKSDWKEAAKGNLPLQDQVVEWESDRKETSRGVFAIHGSCSSLKVLPTKGQVQSAKKEFLVKSSPEWQACQNEKSLHFWYTDWNFKDMKTQVFLLKWWAVVFFR